MKKIVLFVMVFSFVCVACNSGNNKKEEKKDSGFVSEESLGLRKTDLYSENNTEGDKGVFNAPAPGQSQTIERSFENAPPLIPHTVEGFLPIKKDQNLCLSCHLPDVAKAVKATPVPPSHFMNFRPDISMKGGKIIVYNDDETGNTVTKKHLDKLNNARYNCSQCHIPQSNITVEVKNTFVADFRDKKLEKRSNFADVVDEGVDHK